MGLEAATYTNDLDATNPASSDYMSQGDDHLRLIKSAIKATLPGGSAPNYYKVAEVTVASATTCDILGAASDFIAISGTTTITSLGAGTNRFKFVRFTGALTLTHNATSLILPGGANITTAAGDTMIVESDSSSNVRVLTYQKASGGPITLNASTEASVASATTTNIGAATSALVQITGTTTITAFDTVAAGVWRVGRFAGALTLTHNATSLILPGGANITTAAGDGFLAYSLGSGNWVVTLYVRADGAPVLPAFEGAPATVASATTTDIGASNSKNITISGTTTITGLGTVAAGTVKYVTFSGALTLTHNATSLILPGGASITTAAGDTMVAASLGSGNWRVLVYQKANGQAVVGASGTLRVLQVLQTSTTSDSTSTTIPVDNTVPTSSEGKQILSQAITVADDSNKVLCRVSVTGYVLNGTDPDYLVVALFRGSTCIAAAAQWCGSLGGSSKYVTVSLECLDAPATAGSVTYTVRAGPGAGAATIGGIFSTTGLSTLTLEEVEA